MHTCSCGERMINDIGKELPLCKCGNPARTYIPLMKRFICGDCLIKFDKKMKEQERIKMEEMLE